MNYNLTKGVHDTNKADMQIAYCNFATCTKRATTTIRVPISEKENIFLNFCNRCAYNFNRYGLGGNE